MNNWAKLRTICFINDEFIDLPRNLSFESALQHSIVYLQSIRILMDKISCWEFCMDSEYKNLKSKIIMNIRTFNFLKSVLILMSWKKLLFTLSKLIVLKNFQRRSNGDFFTSLGDPKPIIRINLFETKETPEPVYKFTLKIIHKNTPYTSKQSSETNYYQKICYIKKSKFCSKENIA